MHGGGEFPYREGIYACEAEPAGSKLVEVRMACRPAGTKDQRTTLSVARIEPPESTRALSKAKPSIIPTEEGQRVERRKLTSCPKGVGKCPASKPSGMELETNVDRQFGISSSREKVETGTPENPADRLILIRMMRR